MIDSLVDLQLDKAKSMMTSICGASLLGMQPPKSKKLNNKIRMWQIHSDLLEQNPHWVSTGKIVTNGMAWGDEADPIDIETEKAKDESKERVLKVLVDKSKKRKAAKVGRRGQGKAHMDKILDGGDEDALLEV
jgi:hypothetical protein